MKNEKMKKCQFLLLLMSISSIGFAAPYYAWMNEYDGTEAGTLAYWSFNEDTQGNDGGVSTAADVSGNGNTAYLNITDSSLVFFSSDGKWGDSLYKEKDTPMDQAVEVPSLTFSADPSASFEAWVKFPELGGVAKSRYLMSNCNGRTYPGADPYGVSLYMNGDNEAGRIWFNFGDLSEDPKIRTYSPYIEWAANQWYHVAATWDAETDTAKIYRDGELLKDTTFAGYDADWSSTNQPFTIGSRPAQGMTLEGWIDSVRVSDVVYNYAVPEPITAALFGLGSLLMVTKRRRS